MKYKILYKTYPIISGLLEEGERIKFNGVSVLGMSSNVRISKGLDVSFKDGLSRMLNGEAPYWQYITSDSNKGHFLLGSGRPGVIVDLELTGTFGLKIVKESFLACSESVNIGVNFEPITRKHLCGDRKLCTLTGTGIVFIANFGEIHQINLEKGEEYFIDLSCVVAFPDYMKYRVEKSSNGWFNVFSKKEQSMICFSGPGVVLVQTCGENSYRLWNQDIGFALNSEVNKRIDRRVESVSKPIEEELRSVRDELNRVSSICNRLSDSARIVESRTMVNVGVNGYPSREVGERDRNRDIYDREVYDTRSYEKYDDNHFNRLVSELPRPEGKIEGPNVDYNK